MLQRRRPFRISTHTAALVAPLLFALTGCDEVLGLDELSKDPCAGVCVDGAVAPQPSAASTSGGAGTDGAGDRGGGGSDLGSDGGADTNAPPAPFDAGPSHVDAATSSRCGDGACSASESCTSCPADCLECPRPLSAIADTFDGADVNLLLWRPWNNKGAYVGTRSGALEITPAILRGYAGVTSVAALDVTGRETRLEVRQVAGPKGQLETYIQLTPRGGQDHLRMGVSGASFLFSKQIAGVYTNTSSASYDAAAMRWWRIWERAGTTYGEYAPESRGPWTTFASVANPFAMTAVELLIASGSYGTVISPGVAVFDNVNQ